MPINLKGIMLAHGISQQAMADSIRQANGTPLSRPAVCLLINWGYYPKATPAEDIRDQVEKTLRARGISESEIAILWQPESDDRHRLAHPLHVHVGQPAPKPIGFKRHSEHDLNDFDPLEVEMLSPNAKRHFRLFRDPFRDEMAGVDDVFLDADQRYVAEAMFQTARHGGFLAVIGESGSGKTTLRKLLLERIDGQSVRVVFPRVLDKSRLSTSNICQAIINDLAPGQTVRASLEGQARQVERILKDSTTADNTHVLLIEEAHDLSISTLKFLKRFYELEDGFKKLLSIVIIGQPELRDKLDEQRHPEAREVIRRIEIAMLAPMASNLEAYLAHKFKRAGAELAQVFDPSAYDAIRARWIRTDPHSRTARTNLYPLHLNSIATKAMNRAADLGVPLVTGDLIKEI